MDLRQIRYFLNLAETLNFTSAAELSQITQPALTKAIQRLEEELGGRLVYRDGKDTRLTELGRTIRTEFEKIVSSEMRVRDLADSVVNETRTILSIGVVATLGPRPVWDFIHGFISDMPQVEVIVESVDPKVSAELVLSGGLDACFCADAVRDHPKLLATPLYDERLLAGTSISHRFAGLSEIPLKQLAEERYIDRVMCEFRARMVEHCMDRGVLMRPQVRSDREDWVQYAVSRGFGVALFPEHSAMRDDLALTPVAGVALRRTVSLVTISGSATAAAVQRLRNVARTYSWPE